MEKRDEHFVEDSGGRLEGKNCGGERVPMVGKSEYVS